jgi:hypothetical protein
MTRGPELWSPQRTAPSEWRNRPVPSGGIPVRPIKRSLILAALFTVAAALPASAAEPQKPFVLDLNDPALDAEESAFWTRACGFPVTADLSGHIIFHNEHEGAVSSLIVFHITARLTSESGTYFLVDVGPDISFTRNGTPYVAVVGRSITGSGVIGRVLVNLETMELMVSGKLVAEEVFGDFRKTVCRELR